MKKRALLQQNYRGILVAILVGLLAIWIKDMVGSPIVDPLLVALTIGICIRSFVRFNPSYLAGFAAAPSIFIPIGIIFYGAANLNFVEFASVDSDFIFLIFIVFIVYILATLSLSSIFCLKEKVGYLITSGSTICGASAIVITSKSIDAEPDDVSQSLIPVFISALIGLFIILPRLSAYFGISELEYGVLSGAVLQFTGFVKASVAHHSADIQTIALSVKAVRYLGLLFVIPLFASLLKGKFYVPWYLLAFVGAGIIFTFMPEQYSAILKPLSKATLTLLWSIAMGAIGLNANIKSVFSIDGLKACIVSLLSLLIAIGVFLTGILLL
ncbi:YeiH family protein [Candidatus Omnitrophota bacterium]